MTDGYVTPDILADRLEGARRSGAGWTARCPTHEDRHASLKISPGKKGTLLHCHAGCRPADIMAAVGLELQQLFEDYNRTGNSGNVIQMDMARQLREMQRRQTPVDVWEPHSLADVMREALHPTDYDVGAERMAVAGSRFPYLMNLEFEQAYTMYHVVADGPVFAYLEDWFARRRVSDWHEQKHKVMRVLWSYWNQRRKYQDVR